jgi:hypothetical protein
MAERWIIVSHRCFEYQSLETAQAELHRLREKHPTKEFHIIKISASDEDQTLRTAELLN